MDLEWKLIVSLLGVAADEQVRKGPPSRNDFSGKATKMTTMDVKSL
jgi:hypothetical protein